jgi:type I restriction-modification system DNA methylase subunit
MEKKTDYYMQCLFKNVFGVEYNTDHNSNLFESKIPDGYYEANDYFIIIENKTSIRKLKEAIVQASEYKSILCKYTNKHIYTLIGYGTTEKTFNYKLYDNNLCELKIKLNELIQDKHKMIFSETDFHEINQYLYDNSINLPKSQKTLFIASILIVLKLDPNFTTLYETDNSIILADKMLEIIQNAYNDVNFTNQFEFIKRSLFNNQIKILFKMFHSNMLKYGDVLNRFYSEFCIWDKNNDSSLGIVLTPNDIVNLMVNELNIKDNETILDTCTGTGSFLIKVSLINKTINCYGCENNDERYALAKCNFILNDINYSYLYRNSCFNQSFPDVDHIIINPPFSCDCKDELINNNEIGWKSFKDEQRFCLYAIQYLKTNGIGAIIIPRSNFNNSNKQSNKFKEQLLKFITPIKIYNLNNKVFTPNANVECAILIFKKNVNNHIMIDNHDLIIEQIDYSDDGFIIKKKNRIYKNDPIIKMCQKKITFDNDWNYVKNMNLNNIDIQKLIELHKLENYYNEQYLKIYSSNSIQKNWNYSNEKLSDLCSIVKCSYYSENETNGNIPLYGATQRNIPVKFINKFSFDTENDRDENIKKYGILCINKTGDGGAGICYLRTGKFALNATILACKLLKKISIDNLTIISHQLHLILNRSNSLNITKFNDIIISTI